MADRFAEDVRHYLPMMPADEALQKVIGYRTTGDLGIWVTTTQGDLLAQSETLNMGSWQTSGVTTDLLRLDLDNGVEIRPIQAWQFVVCVDTLRMAGLPNAILHIANDITAEYQGLQQLIQSPQLQPNAGQAGQGLGAAKALCQRYLPRAAHAPIAGAGLPGEHPAAGQQSDATPAPGARDCDG